VRAVRPPRAFARPLRIYALTAVEWIVVMLVFGVTTQIAAVGAVSMWTPVWATLGAVALMEVVSAVEPAGVDSLLRRALCARRLTPR